jgi:hypothetical protein
MSRTPPPETALPDDESVGDEAAVARCPYCDRPFVTDRQRALHVGERHDPAAAEQQAYERARREESDELFRLHLRVVVAIGLLYAAFVVAGVVAFSLSG